jgi:hypothetical protein
MRRLARDTAEAAVTVPLLFRKKCEAATLVPHFTIVFLYSFDTNLPRIRRKRPRLCLACDELSRAISGYLMRRRSNKPRSKEPELAWHRLSEGPFQSQLYTTRSFEEYLIRQHADPIRSRRSRTTRCWRRQEYRLESLLRTGRLRGLLEELLLEHGTDLIAFD